MKKYYTTKEVKSKKEDLPMKKQNKWEKLFDEYLDLIEFKSIDNSHSFGKIIKVVSTIHCPGWTLTFKTLPFNSASLINPSTIQSNLSLYFNSIANGSSLDGNLFGSRYPYT